MTLPAVVRIVSPVEALPRRLFLGEVTKDSVVHQTIVIKSPTNSPIRIDAVDMGNTGLECLYSPSNSSTIKVTFAGRIRSEDQISDKKVVVHVTMLNSGKQSTLELPVSGLFRKT